MVRILTLTPNSLQSRTGRFHPTWKAHLSFAYFAFADNKFLSSSFHMKCLRLRLWSIIDLLTCLISMAEKVIQLSWHLQAILQTLHFRARLATARTRRRGRSHPGLPSSSSGGSGERQDTGEWGQSQVVGEKRRLSKKLWVLWLITKVFELRPTCCPKKVHLCNHPKDAGHQNPWQEEERTPLKMSAVCFNLVGTSCSPFSHPSQKGNRAEATQAQNRGVEEEPGEGTIMLL